MLRIQVYVYQQLLSLYYFAYSKFHYRSKGFLLMGQIEVWDHFEEPDVWPSEFVNYTYLE